MSVFLTQEKKGVKGTIENLIEMLKLLLKFKLEKEKTSDIFCHNSRFVTQCLKLQGTSPH